MKNALGGRLNQTWINKINNDANEYESMGVFENRQFGGRKNIKKSRKHKNIKNKTKKCKNKEKTRKKSKQKTKNNKKNLHLLKF